MAAQARLNLHLSKCHIVGNHMSRLIWVIISLEFGWNLVHTRRSCRLLERLICITGEITRGLNDEQFLTIIVKPQHEISNNIVQQNLGEF